MRFAIFKYSKRFVIFIATLSLSFGFHSQTTDCMGSFSEVDISLSCSAANRTVIGDGTAGYIQICIDVNNIGNNDCMGLDEGLRFYDADGNIALNIYGDGTHTIYSGRATSDGGGCFTITSTEGPITACLYCDSGSQFEVSYTTVTSDGNNACLPAHCYNGVEDGDEEGIDCGGSCDPCLFCDDNDDCPFGTECDATGVCVDAELEGCDCPSTVTNNDCIQNADVIDACATAFDGSTTGYSFYGGGTFGQDLDCDGTDEVAYSVENDAYFTFCPGETGTWETSLSTISCNGTGMAGVQYTVLQGSPGDLTTLASTGGGSTIRPGETWDLNFSITDILAGCVYIQVDGYAGAGCEYTLSIECTDCNCELILPVELGEFRGVKSSERNNTILWTTLTEQNNDYFELYQSNDGVYWRKLKTISGQGNTSDKTNYSYTHKEVPKQINYYRLEQVDFNGEVTDLGIVSVDNSTDRVLIKKVNLLGQEVTDDYKGLVILYYSDGVTDKKIQSGN